MFTGLTVALVTGVPLGTLSANALAAGAETFLAVSALGLVAFVGSLLYVPSTTIKHGKPASLLRQVQVLGPQAAAAAGVRHDGRRLWRFLHRFYLSGTDLAAGCRVSAPAPWVR